jgi:RimJ/RimL family protein N-acetyltransferase
MQPTEKMTTRRFGEPLPHWAPPPTPPRAPLSGRYALLEPLSAERHAAALYAANAQDPDGALWDYLSYGPFPDQDAYVRWIEQVTAGDDPRFYAIQDRDSGQWGGVASYLRIAPASGSIEVGHINFAPRLQRTRAATEAMFLMMEWAFEAGYRRYEWKCDALNRPSRRAAERLGFSYEGVFRQATVYKGRNRDTAWFAAIDQDWPALRTAFQAWLRPENFDANNHQSLHLSQLTAPIQVSSDPAVER